MDQKSNIKDRRKKRIRNLLDETAGTVPVSPLFGITDNSRSIKEWNGSGRDRFPSEPDPELMWKERRKGWEEDGGGRRPRFTSGFLRRMVVSGLLFGLVWGVFTVQQPWSLRSQDFIANALNKDMDFEAARVWYEEHFNGAPAFIPIFDTEEEPAQKVAALRDLNPPVAGNVIQPFASTLKGVEIMPEVDSSGSVTVKSVDMGRVLSISREPQGGIRIMVRHTGNLTAEYGHISGTKLEVDDWVQSGDTLGWLQQQDSSSQPLLFFAVMKDKTYIDPAEVIAFD
ncbi:M23 family metallopeptidase [Paenibacillus sp. BR2-3]|uniref:peptidoglycan DD-metalloendopeptidase family protein n=1 Tax=Paenibacillus sp. BR2-3 TaxID=3048494 RepID=UPI0039777010